jgi:hypothetical protein
MSWYVVTLNDEIMEKAGKSLIFLFVFFGIETTKETEWRIVSDITITMRDSDSPSVLLSIPLVRKRTLPASFTVDAEKTKRLDHNFVYLCEVHCSILIVGCRVAYGHEQPR